MFCIKCGGKAEAGNFCKDCFLKSNHLFDIEDFTALECSGCGKLQRGNIRYQIKEKILTKNVISKYEIDAKQSGHRIVAKVTCTGKINPMRSAVREEKKIIIMVKRTKCEDCIKLLGGYYEAVLQVRGERQERILNKIKKFIYNEDITRIETLKEGHDIRLRSKSSASSLVKYLRSFFDIKESYKLVGEKKGKKLYRNYYAIR